MNHENKIIKKEIGHTIYYGYNDNNDIFIIHNENGPAVICSDGSIFWYVHNLKHRHNGPAVILASGLEYWFFNGKQVNDIVEEWLEERNLDHNNLSEEDQLALSFYMESLCREKINVHG